MVWVLFWCNSARQICLENQRLALGIRFGCPASPQDSFSDVHLTQVPSCESHLGRSMWTTLSSWMISTQPLSAAGTSMRIRPERYPCRFQLKGIYSMTFIGNDARLSIRSSARNLYKVLNLWFPIRWIYYVSVSMIIFNRKSPLVYRMSILRFQMSRLRPWAFFQLAYQSQCCLTVQLWTWQWSTEGFSTSIHFASSSLRTSARGEIQSTLSLDSG